MKSLQVLLIMTILLFKLLLTHIQLVVDHTCSVPEALQSFFIVPVQKASTPLDQVFQCTSHFITANILDLSANWLGSWVLVPTKEDFHRFSTDVVGVETVTLI